MFRGSTVRYTVVDGSPYTTYLNIVAITASRRLYRDTMPLKALCHDIRAIFSKLE